MNCCNARYSSATIANNVTHGPSLPINHYENTYGARSVENIYIG